MALADIESTSPGQQQVIVTPDYVGGMASVGTETTPPGGQEESCAPFAGYDYNATRLGNGGYKFNNGAAGNYASYPSNATPPAPHQVLSPFCAIRSFFFTF